MRNQNMSFKYLFAKMAATQSIMADKANPSNATPALRQWRTPGDRMVKIGDRLVNAQGLKLRVSATHRDPGGMDIVVEFMPCDKTLFQRRWQGEFLLPPHTPASEGAPWPRVYLEDIDLMRDAYEMDSFPDATPVAQVS